MFLIIMRLIDEVTFIYCDCHADWILEIKKKAALAIPPAFNSVCEKLLYGHY